MKYTDCIIETPAGHYAKFTMNPKTGWMEINKLLPAGLAFPFDFGYIPGTVGEDGDPLDVLIISELQTFPGCMVSCRIIGAIPAVQTEKNGKKLRNDRYIAIPAVSRQYSKVNSLARLPEKLLEQVEIFFKSYNEQTGKQFRPLPHITAVAAGKAITAAREKAKATRLIRLLLPLQNNRGKAFPKKYYDRVKQELAKLFGGVTLYRQCPAEGLWNEKDSEGKKDELLVFEVMVAMVDTVFWKNYRKKLEALFEQDKLLIQQMSTGLL